MIVRSQYLNTLKKYKDKPFVKVLTGLRRVGKSTILTMFADEIIKNGVNKDNVLLINLELPQFFNIKNYLDLTNYVETWAKGKKDKLYVMFDEIGRVLDWERVINAFHASKKYDIYITGSNADLLSSDLITFLAGRYIEIKIYPLSYKEFLMFHPKSSFNDYIVFGGMPHIAPFKLDYETSMKALRDSYNSAILQDVVRRYNIRNVSLLEKIISYIFANTSKTFSASSISRYLKSEKINATVDTIINYLKFCEDAFLISRVKRNDILGKEILKTEEKFFISDHGYREAMIGFNLKSIELILENIVYMELVRRGYDVYIGKVNNLEIDFVAYKANELNYFQVSYLMPTEETRKREFGVYEKTADNFPKYVISMDQINFSQNGIKHLNIIDFLLNE
jgi:predicted AAA+ superfamily ATPase